MAAAGLPEGARRRDRSEEGAGGEQLEAALVAAATKAQKPYFPSDPVAQTAAVMAALAGAKGPIDARTLAAGFRQGKRVEKTIGATLLSLYRLGHLTTSDGAAFAIRRAA